MSSSLNGSKEPLQLSFPLPHAPQTRIHIHVTLTASVLLLFLTTSTDPATSSGSASPMGSLVYAIPDLSSTSRSSGATAPPLSTTLYPQQQTQDFATRVARILAKRTQRPVYVGNSMSLASAGRGGDVDEEMEALRRVVDVVMGLVDGEIRGGGG